MDLPSGPLAHKQASVAVDEGGGQRKRRAYITHTREKSYKRGVTQVAGVMKGRAFAESAIVGGAGWQRSITPIHLPTPRGVGGLLTSSSEIAYRCPPSVLVCDEKKCIRKRRECVPWEHSAKIQCRKPTARQKRHSLPQERYPQRSAKRGTLRQAAFRKPFESRPGVRGQGRRSAATSRRTRTAAVPCRTGRPPCGATRRSRRWGPARVHPVTPQNISNNVCLLGCTYIKTTRKRDLMIRTVYIISVYTYL